MNLDLFKQWLILNCDSHNTVDTYYRQINKLLTVLGEPLTQESINKYFIKLLDDKKSKSTFNLTLNSLVKYLEFTKQTFELPKEKGVDKRVNRYYTKEQLQKDIIPYLSQLCPRNYEQAELVIKILFLTGLRKQELISLKREYINLEKQEIELLNTKGNRDRLIPFDKILAEQIKKFFNNYPEEINAFNVSEMKLKTIFKNINTQLNLEEPLTPRICRHSCAIHLIRQGLDISYVQQILGHKDIKTTMIYAEPDFNLVKEVYKNKIKGF